MAAQSCLESTGEYFGERHPAYASALNNIGAAQKVWTALVAV